MSEDVLAAGQHLRTVRGRLMSAGAASAADGSTYPIFPIAIPEAEGEALLHQVQVERARRTIEIGLGFGVSALFICEGLLASGDPDARHVALDPNQTTRFSEIGLRHLREAHVDRLVEFHEVPSEIGLPRFLSEGRSFDLAFIDGNHRFDWVFVDGVFLGHLVRPGGVIMLDDYQLRSTQKAVRFFTRNLGWTIEEEGRADHLHHWVVLRTAAPPLERDFDHFVDF